MQTVESFYKGDVRLKLINLTYKSVIYERERGYSIVKQKNRTLVYFKRLFFSSKEVKIFFFLFSVCIAKKMQITMNNNPTPSGNPSNNTTANPQRRSKGVISIAREYVDVNQKKPQSYWDYDNFNLQFNTTSGYEIVRKIGRGKYSEVFEGWDSNNSRPCCIKMLKPVKKQKNPKRDQNSAKSERYFSQKKKQEEGKVSFKKKKGEQKQNKMILIKKKKGGPNIIQLLDCVRSDVASGRTPALVFEYVNNVNFTVLYPTFTDFDVRYYIYELLIGLDYCHSRGIMHRFVVCIS
ncbi:hypothetical protein RFI_18622, partial [Reticulomyxa filosa]